MSAGLHLPDFVRVWINGSEKTSYVTSYERTSSLCQRADTFILTFSKELSRPDPYDEIQIEELYEGDSAYVIKGYIVSVVEDFQKSTFECIGQDKSILLDDYFIHYELNATGQTVDYWISYLAGIVGLSVHFDSYTTAIVGDTDAPTPLGMQTIGDAMNQMERAGAYYIKYDGDLDALRVFRYEISRPTISINNDKTTNISRELSTDKTRNVVKVYGGWRYNIFTGTATVAYGEARVNLPEMLVDKTTVLANPLIKRDSVCRLVASRILAITGNLDDVMVADCHGFYPNIKVGEYAHIDVSASEMSFDGDIQITTISTRVDKEGAITSFKVGDKCPRVSIVPPPEVVFAAGTGAGALISLTAGDSFEGFFEGLSGAAMNSWSIAANKYNQLMLLTDDGVYKRASIDLGTSWSRVTTLDGTALVSYETLEGITVSGMTNVKVEKAGGIYNNFHILGYHTYPKIPSGIQDRYWTLSTKDFGVTWSSMPMYVPSQSGVMPAEITTPAGVVTNTFLAGIGSGVSYAVTGYDIEGDTLNNITVLVAGAGLDISPGPANPTATIYIGGGRSNSFPSWHYDFFGGIQETLSGVGISYLGYYSTGQYFANIEMIETCSIPANRGVAYHLGYQSTGQYFLFRTSGFESASRFQYLTSWIGSTNSVRTTSLLVDYASLVNDSNIVKLAIPTIYVYNSSSTSDLEESASYVQVGVKFITDDVSAAPGSGISTTTDSFFIGSTDYSYGGLCGWQSHPTTTTAAWRGIRNATTPPPARTYPTCVTESSEGGNTATLAVIVQGNGWWEGGEENANPPPEYHLRDIDEKKNIGLFIITVDFDSESITNITCKNWFTDTVLTAGAMAHALRSNAIAADLSNTDSTAFTIVSDAGVEVGSVNKTDSTYLWPTRDIAYYGGDAFYYTSTAADVPVTANRVVDSGLSISEALTIPTSGIVRFKGHPDYGYYGLAKGVTQMWKAERATPQQLYRAGYGPAADTATWHTDSWDFRTASGGYWMTG